MLTLIGWGLVLSGAIAGFIAHDADRRLQAFRLEGEPESAYWFVPLRISRDLYRSEAGPLVQRAWRAIGTMYGLSIAGAILLALGYAGR